MAGHLQRKGCGACRSGTQRPSGPLGDNGGPTPTQALGPGSPAIDAAEPNGCPEGDQRGVSRPADGNGDGIAVCDIGAYEVVLPATPPPQPPTSTAPPTVAPTPAITTAPTTPSPTPKPVSPTPSSTPKRSASPTSSPRPVISESEGGSNNLLFAGLGLLAVPVLGAPAIFYARRRGFTFRVPWR